MSLVTLRQTIADTLDAGIGSVKKVYTHGGRFDLAQLRTYAVTAPCAVVGVLGIEAIEQEGGEIIGPVNWGCFVIAKDTPVMKRDAAALNLVQALLKVIRPSQDWNGQASHNPESIRSQNLFAGELDKTGIAMWAITWLQKQDLADFDVTTLNDLLTVHSEMTPADAEHDDTPIGEDTIALEGVGA